MTKEQRAIFKDIIRYELRFWTNRVNSETAPEHQQAAQVKVDVLQAALKEQEEL